MSRLKLKDIAKHEIIGLYAKVVSSTNKANLGVGGMIIDETKHTLLINTAAGKKRLLKKIIVIELRVNDSTVRINGALLVGRPEDRIKSKVK